ncbi:TonB-dependent receptor [Parapedobacter tibetensis]|uniref:TonB-dependent receptor n=1 Tax=Parapedobacter tibetensis TaxID=2972951 RepID=UPI00214D9CA1|nr:TonB-dependent receptor [Parapedobacter tibetensis]
MDFYQIMRVMKITMVLLTCFLVQVSAATYAQRLNISKQESSIPDILKEIRRQADYDFLYDAHIFNGTSKIKIDIKDASIEQVLAACFVNLPYQYTINNKIVIIKKTPARQSQASNMNSAQQQLLVSGRVIDADSKTTLPGVSIRIKGTNTGATTDGNGNFAMPIPEAGATLVFTCLGYDTKEVHVSAAERNITVTLNYSSTALGEVTIQARRKTDTEIAVLDERRKASIVQDAISAQQIERTGSITTSQALQRVTGVTVTEDKYVAVRGLGDRSVIGQLNGIRLASSNPDRSSVPLDLIPATLLDNITVFKTITPDLPADASGGIIELKTRSIPDKRVLAITAQQGTNSNIGLGGEVNSFFNSDMGFFAQNINKKDLSSEFISLGGQYPGGLAQMQRVIAGANNSTEQLAEVNRINGIMRSFDPVLNTTYRKAPLDGIYGISFGDAYTLANGDKIGVIASGSYYSRSTDIAGGAVNQYSIFQGVTTGSTYIQQSRSIPGYITPNRTALGRYVSHQENTGTQVLNYGLLAGISYRFSRQHEISMQYIGSRGGETQATSLMGQYEYTAGFDGPIYNTTYSLKQTHRIFNTLNLQGEHQLGAGEYAPRLSYNLASSRSSHNDPDFRSVNLAEYRPGNGGFFLVPNQNPIEYIGTDEHYSLVSGYVRGYGPFGLIQADPNGRRFRNLEELNYNYKADLAIPFKIFNRQVFKMGVNYLYRERDFSEYVLSLPGSNFGSDRQLPLYLSKGNVNQLVSQSNIGIRLEDPLSGEGAPLVNGFLYNSLKSPNNYIGFNETNAFYGMLDLKLTDQVRLAGGVRFENTDIQSKVDTVGVYIDPAIAEGITPVYVNPVTGYKTAYRPFYSANLTYSPNNRMNFRFAFNTSLARPELREMTNVFEFDPFLQALVVGNPELTNQRARAFDFRWEWFINPGEVVAVSVFEKQIYDQLERAFILNTAGTSATFPEFPTIAFQNNPNTGQVWGIELELVKDLGLLFDPLKYFFIGSNITLVQSDVVKSRERLEAARIIDRQSPKNSPLFEQAPYSINAFLNYTHSGRGTDLTVNFNVVGERLIQVSMDGTPDIYSNPAPVLDVVFGQRITSRLSLKGYVKNLLNPRFEESYNNAGTGGTFYGQRYLRRSFRRGTEYMLGLTFTID